MNFKKSKKTLLPAGLAIVAIAAIFIAAGILGFSGGSREASIISKTDTGSTDNEVNKEAYKDSYKDSCKDSCKDSYSGKSDGKKIFYSSMTIAEDETLWDISCKYAGENETTAEYIKNVKEINNMSDDTIYSGMNIIYYYYLDESDISDDEIQVADESLSAGITADAI